MKAKCPIHGDVEFVDQTVVLDPGGQEVYGDLMDCDCVVVNVAPDVPPFCL